VLNPQANPSSVSNQQKAKKMNWAQDLAIDFLNSVFNSNIDNRQSIGSAVLMEFTDDCRLQKSTETNTAQNVVFHIQC
jgi:hypothetical protein